MDGFLHLITRGQYERAQPTNSWSRLAEQVRIYAESAVTDFSAVYLVLALLPFCFLKRMRTRERSWILGLCAVYVCLSILLLVVLNPTADKQSRELIKVFFSASHLVLAVWAGYGLLLLGMLLRSNSARGPA